MSDNIKVVVKVRPLIPREIDQKLSFQWRVRNNTLYQLDDSANEFGPSFTFDKIYDENTRTIEVFNDIAKPIVESAISGINGTIFAYGQTSSGKTYTMTGTEVSPGIIPLSVKHLFEAIKSIPDRDFLVRVSYIEIYNETVKDLLNDEKKNIKVYDTVQGLVRFDATERPTSSPEDVLAVMREGDVNRQTGATNMNEESSRSHSIFQITIESRKHVEGEEETGCVNVSQLNLVDLAGSERAGQTGATGLRFKEGTHINKSLSVLALVIKQLSEDPNKHANYRDSKLTRILQNSIGGNAKTSIICAITPASVEETISTLQFANRAKSIKNKPEINAVATNATKIHDLIKQLSKLKTQLESKKNLEQDNVNLQKQIANLQKFILNGLNRPGEEASSSSRKKWQHPSRRITISTLHPIVEDKVAPVSSFTSAALPKFCTPSLKYNPITMDPSEFELVKPGNSQLLSVTEDSREPPRLVTPPPHNPEVVDVINLDSDDDSPQDVCSPYHSCYDKLKTPPCVLRKTAARAEKDLKDIVELTEREKIYTPSVVELLQKLEEYANLVSALEEKLEALSKESQEKDAKMQILQKKMETTENQIKDITSAKMELELKCSESDTKLTDLEVMYETLTKKYKTREQELLSLLEEQERKNKKCDILTLKPFDHDSQFLEMSNISLVSDNESTSADNLEEMHKQHMSESKQTASKDNAPENLTCISKTSINDTTIQILQNKLSKISSENDFLKSTIENLNSNIASLKETIKVSNDDIKSYNALIQELQIKLNERISMDAEIDEINIENMIENEEKLTSNNEKMKNLIQTIKNVIEDKKKESEANAKYVEEIANLKEQVEAKEKEIKVLFESVESLKFQLNENNSMINYFQSLNEDFTNKLSKSEQNNILLQKQDEENKHEICKLVERNAELINVLAEKQKYEIKLTDTITKLETENEKCFKKIADLELDVIAKTKTDKNLINGTLRNLNNILKITSCESINIPEDVEDLYSFISVLQNFLNHFETDVFNIIELKKNSELKVLQVEQEISELKEKNRMETISLKSEILNLSKEKHESLQENQILLQQIDALKSQLSKMCEELENKGQQVVELESELNDIRENNKNLHNELLSKDNMVVELQEKITDLLYEIVNLSHEIDTKCFTLASVEEKTTNLSSCIEEITQDKAHENTPIVSLTEKVVKLLTEKKHVTQEIEDKKSKIVCLQERINELLAENQLLRDTQETVNNNKTSTILAQERVQELLTENLAIKQEIEIKDLENKQTISKIYERINELLPENQNLCDIQELIYNLKTFLKLAIQDQVNELFTDNISMKQEMEEKDIDLDNRKCPKINLMGNTQAVNVDNYDSNAKLNFLQILVESKNTQETRLRKSLFNLRNTQTIQEFSRINTKNQQISEPIEKVNSVEKQLKYKCDQISLLSQELSAFTNNSNMLLNSILDEATKIFWQLGSLETTQDNTTQISFANNEASVYDQIIFTLHKISENIKLIYRNEKESFKSLSQTKDTITELTERNTKLNIEFDKTKIRNKELLEEMECLKKVNQSLYGTSNLIEQLKHELRTKSHEVELMEAKTNNLKTDFDEFQQIVSHQMDSLRKENEKLKNSLGDGNYCSSNEDMNQSTYSKNSEDNHADNLKLLSPESLHTICCNKIIEVMHTQEENLTQPSNKKSYSMSRNIEWACECIELNMQLKAVKDERRRLVSTVRVLQSANLQLTEERDNLRKEVQTLVDASEELHKKIVSHRTNLSTLTATTYAENKLLKSQLKVLTHHHARCIYLCQRDIPAFKMQLQELMTILKSSNISENQSYCMKSLSSPDYLDNDTTMSTLKNESVLDGDILMLDTNLTLSTSVDNDTLVGNDRSCLNVTNITIDEIPCQNHDEGKVIDPCYLQPQIEFLIKENKNLCKAIEELKQENIKLRSLVKYDLSKHHGIVIVDSTGEISKNVNDSKQTDPEALVEKLKKELETLEDDLTKIGNEKASIEKKYSDLLLELPSSEVLINKISLLENTLSNKTKEICKLTQDISIKNKTIKDLEKENEELSNQLMENILAVDDLKSQIKLYNKQNIEATALDLELNDLSHDKAEVNKLNSELDVLKKELDFSRQLILENEKETKLLRQQKLECMDQLKILQHTINQKRDSPEAPLLSKTTPENYSKLNRSLSDSENSFRYHRIVTLQHELDQSQKECKKITEEVSTIKNDFKVDDFCRNVNLDESMKVIHSNFKDDGSTKNLINIREELLDDYTKDKINCLNFLIEKTDADRSAFGYNVKIAEIMQSLYSNLISKHNNEIENISNKLKDFQESKSNLEMQLKEMSMKYSDLLKEIIDKDIHKVNVNVLNDVRAKLEFINTEINSKDTDKSKVLTMYKENILKVLDVEFGFNTASIYDSLINYVLDKNKKDLEGVVNSNKLMKERLDCLLLEFENSKSDLVRINSQIIEQNKECDNLKEQKKTIEGEYLLLQNGIKNTISNIFGSLRSHSIVVSEYDASLPLDQNLKILFDQLLIQLLKHKTQKEDEELKITTLKHELQQKENELKAQKSSHEELDIYHSKTSQEREKMLNVISNFQGKSMQKQTSINKEEEDLSKKIEELIAEFESLKSVHTMILKEKDYYTVELEKASAIIKQNKEEMDKMTADILQLRDTVKGNIDLIESMKSEAKSMLDENMSLKEKLHTKNQDCCRLEMNIKTLEKSIGIQNRMIKRLQKQIEDDKVKMEKDNSIEELTQKCLVLQTECKALKTAQDEYMKQIEVLTVTKSSLEARVTELQQEWEAKNRFSIEALTNNAQRRRKSIHDSNRIFSEENIDFETEQDMIQAVFDSRDAPQDMFMDVDEYEDDDNRSTPLRLSKGRESLNTKNDQNEQEERLSRPSSVQAIRRRRQSIHDQHRSVVGSTPSPAENQDTHPLGAKQKNSFNSSGTDKRDSLTNSNKEDEVPSRPSSVLATRRKRQSMYDQCRAELATLSPSPPDSNLILKASPGKTEQKISSSCLDDEEVTTLRERLARTEEELENLKEKYRELDEECETCAQYLHERDKRCAELRKEKVELEKVIKELQDTNSTNSKPSLITVAVNTDEDWAHLHSVVVDRMSFDAEVEKNKRLMKTVEELRYSKQELNNLVGKMQKALERQATSKEHKEFETLKCELKSCKEELSELKERYRELDEECETCAQLLREKEQQCRVLKEAKAMLEAKLKEYQEEEGLAVHLRKRRHNAHDASRISPHDFVDAATETGSDLQSYQGEKELNLSQAVHESLLQEISSLKSAYETLSLEKATLEHVLANRQVAAAAVPPTMFVSTGSAIVQGQQISDLMKENHKLKKINAKLVHLCKKRGKPQDNQEEEAG